MDKVLAKHAGAKLQVFVIWEKVLRSDQEPPSTATLSRVSFHDTVQFWDPERTVSKAFGETSDKTIVWDCVYVYPAGTQWADKLPVASDSDHPVLDVIDAFDRALP